METKRIEMKVVIDHAKLERDLLEIEKRLSLLPACLEEKTQKEINNNIHVKVYIGNFDQSDGMLFNIKDEVVKQAEISIDIKDYITFVKAEESSNICNVPKADPIPYSAEAVENLVNLEREHHCLYWYYGDEILLCGACRGLYPCPTLVAVRSVVSPEILKYVSDQLVREENN